MRGAIVHGDLVPGQFYSEAQLARVLEISRTPVREALAELAREGAIEKIPQRGFRLRLPTLAEVEEAYALRALVEGYVVARFTREASSEAIAHLAAVVKVEAATVGTPMAVPVIGDEFHLAMPMAIGLRQSYRSLVILRPSVWLSDSGADRAQLRKTVREHRHIVDRITARDVEGAVEAITRHIEQSAAAARERWATIGSTGDGSSTATDADLELESDEMRGGC